MAEIKDCIGKNVKISKNSSIMSEKDYDTIVYVESRNNKNVFC